LRPAIDANRPFVIGNSPDVDLLISGPAVSPNHCEIRYEQGRVILHDVGTKAGTVLNGLHVTKPVALADGDVIEIGNAIIRVADPEKASPARSPDQTIIAEADHAPAAPTGTWTIALDRSEVVIGRDESCHVTFPNPVISRRHATIQRIDGEYIVQDQGSVNGTFVNGELLTERRRLVPGDRLRVGFYRFAFTGTHLVTERELKGIHIVVEDLGKQDIDRNSGRPIWIFRDIAISIAPGQLVGIIGSTGCGKSTFLDAVNGRRPATTGKVCYDGENLYNTFDAFKASIGYVPQELILYEALSIEGALRYSCRLRLPPDTTEAEIEQNITRVLRDVGLATRRTVQIRKLSGGQRKRVSIASELLGQPKVLFLDEATSGLDVVTEAEMMRVFRNLSNRGTSVVCITHHAQSIDVCDRILYIVGGRMAYYGPPDQLVEYFGVSHAREVYIKESQQAPEEWAKTFRQSALWNQHVEATPHATGTAPETNVRPGQRVEVLRKVDLKKQWNVCLQRYTEVFRADVWNMRILLMLAPLIGLLIRIRFGEDSGLTESSRQYFLAFSTVITMLFLGLFGSVREVVGEVQIYKHERYANLSIPPYLGSKAALLGVVNAIQAFELLIILTVGDGLDLASGVGSSIMLYLVLWLTALSATMLGLAISCAVRNSNQAVLTMIVVMMPQIIYTDALGPLRGVTKAAAMMLVPGYWSFNLHLNQLSDSVWASGVRPDTPSSILGVVMLVVFAGLFGLLAALLLHSKDERFGKPYTIPWVPTGTWIVWKTRAVRYIQGILGSAPPPTHSGDERYRSGGSGSS